MFTDATFLLARPRRICMQLSVPQHHRTHIRCSLNLFARRNQGHPLSSFWQLRVVLYWYLRWLLWLWWSLSYLWRESHARTPTATMSCCSNNQKNNNHWLIITNKKLVKFLLHDPHLPTTNTAIDEAVLNCNNTSWYKRKLAYRLGYKLPSMYIITTDLLHSHHSIFLSKKNTHVRA